METELAFIANQSLVLKLTTRPTLLHFSNHLKSAHISCLNCFPILHIITRIQMPYQYHGFYVFIGIVRKLLRVNLQGIVTHYATPQSKGWASMALCSLAMRY